MSFTALLLSAVTIFSLNAQAAQIEMGGADYVPLLDQPWRTCASQVTDWNNKEDLNLPGITAFIGTVRLFWQGPGTLQLDSMTVSFTGPQFPNGQQDVVISGEELGYLWSSDNVVPTFRAGEGRSTTPFCQFRVGGLKVADKYEYFEGTGTIRVSGRYEDNGQWKKIEGGDLLLRYHMSPMPRP